MIARTIMVVASSALILCGCATIGRAPPDLSERAYVPGFPRARLTSEDGYPSRKRLGQPSAPLSVLALSGGGADGSFGAGFLKGWSETGRRPNFDIVTGSSVGALIAPFAFLGSEHDDALEAIFTSGVTDDLLRFAGVNAVVGSAIFKSRPLHELIARYADDRLIDAIAVKHRSGRSLIIATTNLDAQKTVLWNMGEIASSEDPRRYQLFREVLAASAAVPGIFPPTFIGVRVDGSDYAEMHVDGGVTSNVIAVPEGLITTRAGLSPKNATIFMIVNGKLSPEPVRTSDMTLPIVVPSFQTSVKANTWNTIIATYDFCRRNDWGFNAAAIDAERFTRNSPVSFDKAYMRDLYDYGRAKGASSRGFETNLDRLARRR